MIAEAAAEAILDYVQAHDTADVRRQFVVYGLPAQIIAEVQTALAKDSRIGGFAVYRVTVSPEEGSINWDTLVHRRDTIRRFIALASPDSHDSIHYSILNATTPIGAQSFDGNLEGTLEHLVMSVVARKRAIAPGVVNQHFEAWLRHATDTDATEQRARLWTALGRLLEPDVPEHEAIHYALGLPYSESAAVEEACEALDGLREAISDETTTGALQRLREEHNALAVALTQLEERLMTQAVAMANDPLTQAFTVRPTDLEWWRSLPTRDLLVALRPKKDDAELVLRPIDALNVQGCLPPGWYVVRSAPVKVIVSPVNAEPVHNLHIVHGRREIVRIGDIFSGPQEFVWEGSPSVARLDARADGASGWAKILVLDQHPARCFAFMAGAKCKPPRRERGKSFSQLIVLPSAGDLDLIVLCATGAESVHVKGSTTDQEFHVVDNLARIPLKVEEAGAYFLTIKLPGSSVRVKLSVELDFPDDEAAEPSRLQALLRAHATQGRPPRVVPLRIPATQLEGRILSDAESWRPLVVAVAPAAPLPPIDWREGRIGDIPIQRDPRPAVACLQAPPRFLKARERLQAAILHDGGFQLAAPGPMMADIRELLEAYAEWHQAKPIDASWCDTIAVMEPSKNPQAATWTASGEPMAILLSPLHPVRLAWWAATYLMLEETLAKPCPLLAGIESHSCLDSLALHIHDIQPSSVRAFVSVPTTNAGWSLLWHSARLRDIPNSNAMALLESWGLGAPGLAEGMNAGQARRALDDAVRLLPAHATLRLGVVGASAIGASTSQGIMNWVHERFEGPAPSSPERLEVLDARAPTARPFPREVAHAFEASGGRATWHVSGQRMRADVVLVDHLDLREPQGLSGVAGRTVSARGLAARFRIRLDEADASTLLESRAGRHAREGEGFEELLERVVLMLEAECSRVITHIQFEPNLTSLQSWLDDPTHYVAVSSSELDAACFARGSQSRGGYLWEYTLPELLVSGPRAPGYFLMARKSEPLREAIQVPLANLGCPADATEPILDEISRRGIPVLKRLAMGGSSGKGELGTFLTARFLQDAFRVGKKSRLPVWDGEAVTLIVPVDPYAGIFESVRQAVGAGANARRGDLIVLQIRVEGQLGVHVAVVESKWRQDGVSEQTLKDGAAQARDFASLLHALWATSHPLRGWHLGARILLAHIADQAMRIYGDPNVTGLSVNDWSVIHERVLNTVLGNAPVAVRDIGYVIAAGGEESSRSFDFDADGVHETIVVSRTDAKALVAGDGSVDPEIEAAFRQWRFFAALVPGASLSQGGAEVAPPGPKTTEQIPASSRPGSEPPDERLSYAIGRVEDAFKGFIGNEPAVANIGRDLKRALLDPDPALAKNFLLTGNPSTGKTEVAKRMATALGLPFVHVDGTSVESRDALFDLVNAKLKESGKAIGKGGQEMGLPLYEYPAFVVLIDEVHLCRRPVQEALLTLLQEHRTVLSEAVAHAPRATFVLATTRPTDVDSALRSRCMEVRLRPYTEEEVAQMLHFSHPELGAPVRLQIAALARSVPRVARSIATDVITESRVTPIKKSWHDHLAAVRESRGMDTDGITEDDLAYLRVLDRAAGPIGEKSIVAALVSPDYDHIRFDVEPFLQARRLIELTPKGRVITALGRERLRMV